MTLFFSLISVGTLWTCASMSLREACYLGSDVSDMRKHVPPRGALESAAVDYVPLIS
jgi:hypothetical protein